MKKAVPKITEEEIMSAIKDAIATARGKLDDLQEEMEVGKEHAADAFADLRKVMKKNPGTTLLVTFAAGMVLGLVLRPGRRS